MSNEFQEALDDVRKMNEVDTHDIFTNKVRSTIKGSAVGLVAGIFYGFYKQKNIYVTALLGALAGGTVNFILFTNE